MNNLDLEYQNLLKDILENGVEKDTRNGKTLSVFGRQIRYKFKDGKFPLLTTKKMYWKGIVTELLWFLRGDTNIKFLVDNDCHIWDGDAYKNYFHKTPSIATGLTQEEFINKIKTDDEFAQKWGELGPIYGYEWRNWNGEIDQISDLIKQLKENPDSRRLLVSAWNISDLPHQVLPPCHYGFQVYTRELSLEERLCIADKFNPLIREDCLTKTHHPDETEERKLQIRHKWLDSLGPNVVPQRRAISLMWNQRSVDTFLGLPFNIASYGLLLEIIAKEVNMVPDELIGNLGDTHLYLNHIEQAKEQMTREPYPLPKLHINDEFWSSTCLYDTPEEKYKNVWPDLTLHSIAIHDFTLENYQSHPPIKAKLSN
jgi:thymidylate synthase